MRLEELASDTKLNIEVSYGANKLFYEANVALNGHGGVFVEPIKHNGKMIDFSNSKLMIKLEADIDGEQPIIWSECFIKGVKYKDSIYHMISSKKIGIKINRRGRYRLAMGYTGRVRVGSHKASMNIIVHDLSASGFSFTTDKNMEDYAEADVRLVFIDSSNDTKFDLMGEIVRKQEWNDNRFLYGCRLIRTNGMIEHYIATKQRELVQYNSKKVEMF